MSEYPYVTNLDVRYAPLERVSLPDLVAACDVPWFNQTLVRVNDAVVRIGIVQGEYHWHKHDDEDEFFYTVSGRLLVDVRDGEAERTIELPPEHGVSVPRGVVHRTRAPERTVILMVEGAGVVPTGD